MENIKIIFLKGTVSIILSDPPCKNGTARFKTVRLKAFTDHWFKLDINVYKLKEMIIFNCGFSKQ